MGVSAYLEFRTQMSRTGALQRRLVGETSPGHKLWLWLRPQLSGRGYSQHQPQALPCIRTQVQGHSPTRPTCRCAHAHHTPAWKREERKSPLLPSFCTTLPIASVPVCLAHTYDILLALLSSLHIFHELLALSPYFQGFVADMCPLWALTAAPCSISIVKLAGY